MNKFKFNKNLSNYFKFNIRCQSTFSKANRGAFFQDEPQLRNQYKEDAYLREHLKLVIPTEV